MRSFVTTERSQFLVMTGSCDTLDIKSDVPKF